MEIKQNVSSLDVAKMIDENHIVAISQGRSEAGPRALGNRSILFNPMMPDGMVKVNLVKAREYWRPFAGVILHEYVHEWFDMKRLDESPYMSYAIKFKTEEQSNRLSVISHRNTCRIQTLKREQNPNFYELISNFHSLNDNPPVIGNTSFNLAGEPLVETFEDAIHTLEESLLEYLYLPEKKELVFVKNK